MKLSPRLSSIAERVPPGLVVADIGTEHAYLPIYLVRVGRTPFAIGVEVADHPLASARRRVELAALQHRISLRKGWGLEALRPGEAEVAVLAGMGGNTIIEILEGNPPVLARLKFLILQPMKQLTELRRWLNRHNWSLLDEDLVQEGSHFYTIMLAAPAGTVPDGGPDSLSDLELEIGPLLLRHRHPLLKTYLQQLILRQEKIASQMRGSWRSEIKAKEAAVLNRLRRLKELEQELG